MPDMPAVMTRSAHARSHTATAIRQRASDGFVEADSTSGHYVYRRAHCRVSSVRGEPNWMIGAFVATGAAPPKLAGQRCFCALAFRGGREPRSGEPQPPLQPFPPDRILVAGADCDREVITDELGVANTSRDGSSPPAMSQTAKATSESTPTTINDAKTPAHQGKRFDSRAQIHPHRHSSVP